jgi:zinc and cadmium transporter
LTLALRREDLCGIASTPATGEPMPADFARFAVYAVAIFSISFAGGLVPLLRRWSPGQLQTLISLSAGIILGVLFLELLPEVSRTSPHFFTAALAGFVLLLALEKFVFIHPHETEELAGRRTGLAAYVGISFHSLLDGIALGSSAMLPDLAPAVVYAIVAHKVPDTFSLSSILTFFGYSRRRTLGMLLFFSLLTPLGGALAVWLLRGVDDATLGGLLGLASGTFLFIATSDLLPHAHEHREGRFRNLAAVLLGMLVIYLGRRLPG